VPVSNAGQTEFGQVNDMFQANAVDVKATGDMQDKPKLMLSF